MIYSKKQFGSVFLILMLIILSATSILLYYTKGTEFYKDSVFYSVIIAGIIACLLFFQLKVTVSDKTLLLVYGIGLIRIKKNLGKLMKVEVIKTPWYYGILIRITSEGMLYNIQGSGAVRITYVKDGIERIFMVGTPEPEKLKKVLEDNFEIKSA